MIANVVRVFSSHFFILLYFPVSNSNNEAEVGLTVLQACLWHDEAFEAFVSRLLLLTKYLR